MWSLAQPRKAIARITGAGGQRRALKSVSLRFMIKHFQECRYYLNDPHIPLSFGMDDKKSQKICYISYSQQNILLANVWVWAKW